MVLFLKHNLPTIDPGLCTGISEVLICGEGGVQGRALPLCAAVIQLPLLKGGYTPKQKSQRITFEPSGTNPHKL